MGKRGPKPTPTVLKLLRGNPGKRAVNTREPKPAVSKRLPQPPSHLGKLAKQEWRRIVPELHRLGMLTSIDRNELARYCELWARWREANDVVVDQGMTFTTDKGYVCQRPEMTLSLRLSAELRRLADAFGLNPSARSRIDVRPPSEAKTDPDEDFLFNRKSGNAG